MPESMPESSDADFLATTADRLAALPGVRAVALGGSRADGTHRPDSDWDLAVYYRGPFDPDDLRALGWPGEVSEIGGWGGGVFNGGAWLTVDGRRVDVHYRDLGVVEHELAEAAEGRFRVEPLLFHLAGIPSYLVVAELALNQVLRGNSPARPGIRRDCAAPQPTSGPAPPAPPSPTPRPTTPRTAASRRPPEPSPRPPPSPLMPSSLPAGNG
jgi:predicted nucleotidyltransferase